MQLVPKQPKLTNIGTSTYLAVNGHGWLVPDGCGISGFNSS